MVKGVNVVAVFVVAAALLLISAKAEGGWRWGRATFYGIWWSIHTGSCGYGNIDYWQGTGWNVAAIPDSHYEYHWSCGKCYEVKCEPMNFKDNYGNHLDRSHACYDPHKIVTVTIVDSCPCNYASNSYSNKRWCCGDMDHFDLSYHAYDQLAARRWGVIGLKYRPVQCPGSFRLENRHHLGRKLMGDAEEGDTTNGPQMYVIDERYEYPEDFSSTVNSTLNGGEAGEKLLIEFLGEKTAEKRSEELVGVSKKKEAAGKLQLNDEEAGEQLLVEFVGEKSGDVKDSTKGPKVQKSTEIEGGLTEQVVSVELLMAQKGITHKFGDDCDESSFAPTTTTTLQKNSDGVPLPLKQKLQDFLSESVEKRSRDATVQQLFGHGSFKEAAPKFTQEVGFEIAETKRL